MAGLPAVPGTEVAKALERAGFAVVRVSGSHHVLRRTGVWWWSRCTPARTWRRGPCGASSGSQVSLTTSSAGCSRRAESEGTSHGTDGLRLGPWTHRSARVARSGGPGTHLDATGVCEAEAVVTGQRLLELPQAAVDSHRK